MPIAAEDYGDMSMKFKVVAVARKTDKSTTLFNMKGLICTSSPIDDLWPTLIIGGQSIDLPSGF